MIQIKKTFSILAVCLLMLQCDAPRNNPLDAHNPDSQYGLLQGTVLSQSLPYVGLPFTTITFTGDSSWTQSDARGKFIFRKVKLKAGWLYFRKSGYHSDSLFIKWTDHRTQNIEAHLNALPVLDSLLFYSSVTNRYPTVQKLELFLKAWLWDRDQDIDSVFLHCPSLNATLPLQYNSVEKYYQRDRITLSDLHLQLADELVGHTFFLEVKDMAHRRIKLSGAQIQRIIRQEINLKSPIDNTVVSSTPTLRWEPMHLDYQFTYTVEVRTNEVDPQLVWLKNGLPPETSQLTIDQPLPKEPTNQYIWAVWIVDRFGNRARSKFKSFQVE